ncbi:MAG: hypothetical protein L6R40_005113 [Gallowayella cf. fulva]|nr:MAG: hypothetical protein L6R40_005113 [Xanthomendoza cf. fulva]
MDNLDGSDHYSKTSEEPPPSLLTIILDTHPSAWALLSPTLPFSTFLAHLLVFINAHLACNNSNQICVIAAHPLRAEFLYPSPSHLSNPHHPNGSNNNNNNNNDGLKTPAQPANGDTQSHPDEITEEANHYRPFLHLQRTLLASLTSLLKSHPPPSSLPSTPSVALSGALTLALTHHNRLLTSLSTPTTTTTTDPTQATTTTTTTTTTTNSPKLSSRILLLSLTGALSAQYIPLTNTIFACQRLAIPISIAKLAGDAAFLEQASDSTHGTYLKINHPKGLLQYLMMAFLPDPGSSSNGGAGGGGGGGSGGMLRAIGEKGLKLGNYGQKPAVVVRKKKRRRNRLDGANGDTGSGAATPAR